MKILLSLYFGLCILSFSNANSADPSPIELSRSIVKIQALSENGKQSMGSGVVIAPNKIATNCHVTRSANRTYLIKEDRLYKVLAQAPLPEFDVCILETEPVTLPVVLMAKKGRIKMRDDIAMYGYPYALNLRMMRGKVIGLHPYAHDQVIEINAGFNFGASGGGVFNSTGKLIGLMTFMGQTENLMHYYVIPVSWLAKGLATEFVPLQAFSDRSFWEKGDFIRVADKRKILRNKISSQFVVKMGGQ